VLALENMPPARVNGVTVGTILPAEEAIETRNAIADPVVMTKFWPCHELFTRGRARISSRPPEISCRHSRAHSAGAVCFDVCPHWPGLSSHSPKTKFRPTS
jgi:hypothetical protein